MCIKTIFTYSREFSSDYAISKELLLYKVTYRHTLPQLTDQIADTEMRKFRVFSAPQRNSAAIALLLLLHQTPKEVFPVLHKPSIRGVKSLYHEPYFFPGIFWRRFIVSSNLLLLHSPLIMT